MLDLAKLFFGSRDLGFFTDLRGAIQATTQGSERALGYTQAELVGLDLPHLDDSGELGRVLGTVPPRSRMNLGFRLRTKSGAVLAVGAMLTSLRDDSGNPVGWFIAGQDLRGAVCESRESQPILDALINSIGAALWCFDHNGTVITWTKPCERVFGISRQEAEGKLSVLRLFPSPADYRSIIEVTQRTGQFSGEVALLGSDGVARPNQVSMTPLISGALPLGYTCVSFDIAERKRAQELQRAYFGEAGEAIIVVDFATQRFLEANAKAWEIHGYTREEFLELETADVADPEGRPDMASVLKILEETGRYEGDGHIHRRKDGSKFPVAITLRKVSVGGRSFLICVVRDLTEQRKAEEFQRVLFEQAGEAIVVVELATRRILEANARACELHGYPREDFLKLRIDDIVASDAETQSQVPAVARTLEERGRYEGRRTHRRQDGSLFPCWLNLKTVAIGGRRLVIGVHRDLTEQLKAEEFHRVLFEQAGEAIVVVDHPTRKVLDANDKAAELHGYPREEFLRLRVEDYVAPITPDEVMAIGRALEERGHYEGRQLHRRKDGSIFPCSLNLKSSTGLGRNLVIGVHRDLTEELKAEEFFRVLFERASDALYLVNDDGLRVVEANEAACRMLGYTREEFLTLGVVDLVPPPYRARIPEFHESVRKGVGYRRDRRMLFRKDGTMVATDQAVSRVEIAGRPYYIASCRDLTEQERVSRELEEAKSFLEHVQENASDGLALWDENGVYVAVNRKYLEMIGARREDVIGIPWMKRVGPEQAEAFRPYWERLMRGERVSMRSVLPRPDAPSLTVDINSTMIYRGEHRYVFSIMRDVSEQVKTEEELRRSSEDLERHVAERTAQLRQSEARFRSITEATPLPVTITRLDGEILYVNEAASRLFRLGSEGTLGRNAAEFYADPADRLAMKDRIQKEGTVSGNELMFRRSDGTLFWTVVNLRLLTFEGGPAILGSFVDIDERKRSEEALRESEVRFRAITEGVPVAVVIARASDGRILYANETAANSLGLAQGVVEGRTVGEFLARPRDREEIQERLTRDGFVRDLELQFRKVDGTRFWGISSLRLATYKGERATLGVFSDISARKKAEEMLRKAHEELELRVVERTAELARANALLQEEIAERKRTENTLRVIVEGTAAVTGGSFFRSLARHLASALNVRYALVVQGIGRPPRRARTMAFWNGSDFADPLEYDIQGTPCEDVLGGEACCYSHDVLRLFPDFKVLSELDVDSYLGVPIADSTGTVVGQLVVMDLEPVSDVELKLSVLKIFAARAGVELERQLAEEALRESEERWRSLVANAPDIITTVDREGRILSINRLFGSRLEDLLGKPVYGFVPPDFVERVRKAIDTVFREGRPVSYETLSGGPTGAPAWYSSRVGPVVLDGRVAAATIISTDITERWKAEQRQKVQHEVTQILAEAASLEEAVPRLLQRVCEVLDWKIGLLWRIDAAANVLRLADFCRPSNPALHAFMESTRDFSFSPGIGLPGRVWKDGSTHWIPDVSQDANFPRRPAATRAGMHAAFAVPVEGPQGTFGVIEFLSSEIRERDEPLLQVVTTLGRQLGQFIERKRAEEDLRFQKSLLESQSEAAIDGILVVSRDGVMTSFNRRFCQMWEIPDEVLRSKTDEGALQSVLDKLKDPKEFLARVRYLYDHPDQESRDEIHLKDGRAIDRYSAPVKGTDGELYGRVWYFRDVTGRKQTEENLRRAATETRQMYENLKEAQAQLIRSEKLASIGMLVSGVAHEINNPLNVMYGNLQLLAEVSDVLLPLSVAGAKSKKLRGTVGKVAKFRGMIRDALKAARHAREIVQDFRNFARDTRTAELVDLNQCLEEAVTLIQRELRPGIRVVRKLGRIPQVRCLRGQMSQVFLNLLKNAGESIERKGTVTLRTKQKNGQVQVEVADTGRGMPEEIRRKLFEPFFTTKPVGKGLGLGLSISAMIVHNHNGNITVSSQPGKGSVFRVTLPLPL